MGIAADQPTEELRGMVMRSTTTPIARVVVGVDGSADAKAAVQWAAAEACRRQVVLRIVSAWDDQDEPGPPHDPAWIAAARVHKALRRVLYLRDYPHRIACATPRGNPGQALLGEAGETGLLVLGVTGDAPVFTPGRVNRYCLRYGRGPLVFVPAGPAVLQTNPARDSGHRQAFPPSAHAARPGTPLSPAGPRPG